MEGFVVGNRLTSWIPASAGMTSWIRLIRDHIAANLSIEPDDVQEVLVSREAWMPGATEFEYAPFSQQGGLGKVHQIFGDKLNAIIEELNETLAA